MEDCPHVNGESERLESRLARIDERTEWIVKKLESHCIWETTISSWKDIISTDVSNLKSADLPNRISKLENWRWYIGGALALLCILITGRYVVGPTSWP